MLFALTMLFLKVSVLDSVVQGGDAAWEGLRVYDGKVFKLEEHLDRLCSLTAYYCDDFVYNNCETLTLYLVFPHYILNLPGCLIQPKP